MAISKNAVAAYLAQEPTPIPAFKEMSDLELQWTIYNATGRSIEFLVTAPRPHQMQGLAFALYQRSGLLFFDPRMGKTFIALHWARHLKLANLWRKGKGLVIVHAPIALDVWIQETWKHTDLNIRTISTNGDDFIEAIESDCDLIAASWSSLQVLFTRKGINRKGKPKLYASMPLLKEFAQYFDLAIIDEIHACKNHLSLRFQIGAALTAECKYRVGLTGTPVGRDAFAVWSQTFLIDRGTTLGYNYYFFENAFGKRPKFSFNGRPVFDKQKTQLLERRLSSLSMPYRLKEIRDVKIERNTTALHMWGRQLEVYGEVVERLVQINANERAEIVNTFARLRQVASGFMGFTNADGQDRMIHFDENPKRDWLIEMALHAPSDVQVLVFHEFIETGRMICEALARAKITHTWLYGGTKDVAETLNAFKTGKAQFLAANTAKGGLSIDLPMADYVVFFESPTSSIIRQQAEMRPMARPEDRMLIIDDLICSGVERRILDMMAEGRDLMNAIVHDRHQLLADFRASLHLVPGRHAVPPPQADGSITQRNSTTSGRKRVATTRA